MLTKSIEPSAAGNRYAIGDIHGRTDSLVALLNKIKFNKNDALFLLGDYIDRGPDSKGVIDFLMKLQKSYRVMPLLGNHELMLLFAYNDPNYAKIWSTEYGAETLTSFGITNIRKIDTKYIHWILSLPKVTISGNHVLSHAGVNFQSKDTFKDTKDNRINTLFRDDAIPDKKGRYRAVVGHKTKGLSQCLESATGPIIYLDAGCGKRKTGALVSYCLDNDRMEYVKNAS